MVKMSDPIICQRFIQNAWKKDLCSNCFKSKEDHVTIPEGKITYRWTSHINNFPRHGILKDKKNINKGKLLAVSFQTNECEIIGFGGEAYSSDDEFYPPSNDDTTLADTDNEEGIEEFRKLTCSNTDFNSVPANLRIDEPVREDTSAAITYADLKLGKPLLDAQGRRQTIRVTVEPFQSSPLSSTVTPLRSETMSEIRSRHHHRHQQQTDRTKSETKKDSKFEKIDYKIVSCDLSQPSCDIKHNNEKNNCTNILKFNLNDNVDQCNAKEADNQVCHVGNQFSDKTSIIVKVTKGKESGREIEKVSVLKPAEISATNYEQQTKSTEKEASSSEEKRQCSAKKDSNPICLPLIACKTLEIDLDKPNCPDTADANVNTNSDLGQPSPRSQPSLTASAECHYSKLSPSETLICASPQSSFLHNFSKDGSKAITKSVSSILSPLEAALDMKETPTNSLREITDPSLCLPRLQTTNNGTNSTKRQAPKPPYGHMPTTPVPEQNAETPNVTSHLVYNNESSTEYEQQQIDFNKATARNRNHDQIVDHTESKLTADITTFSKRSNSGPRFLAAEMNNLTRYITHNPDAIDKNYKFEDFDSSSVCGDTPNSGRTRSATKCSRSLSCDSIVSPHAITSSEKSRKYSSATIKVKSKIRKFLRFTEKDEEKTAVPETTIPVSRKRIEIIHPLDLNKSSVEILRSSTLSDVRLNDNEIQKKTEYENNSANKKLSQTNTNRFTCTMGRPTKPPPPPRTQSLDQEFSEISKPVRPPPPKSLNSTPQNYERTNPLKDVPNVYENIGDSRQGIAPAKPQRASSMRDRTRQLTSPSDTENTVQISAIPEYETVPECDQSLRHQSQSFETVPTSSMVYCGSETESDICFYSITSQDSDLGKNGTNDDELHRRRKSIVHGSLEDNYGAVVIANHEALSRLLEQVNEAIVVPNALKTLHSSDLTILFEHLRVNYDSRITIYDWNIYNAVWADTSLVVSISKKQFATTRSLPSYLTLYPLIKFTDTIPRYVFENNSSNHTKINAYITIWNEERIHSFTQFCKTLDKNLINGNNERGLLLVQLTNAFKHLQSLGVEEISLDEIFACKRSDDKEWKLVLFPFDIRFISYSTKQTRISLGECICHILSVLLPNTPITETISRLLKNSKGTSMALTNAITEYWLWGPCDVNLKCDRQTSLQRWLDLERATFLHKIVCKPSNELSSQERWYLIFLVHTDSKILAEASHIFEKQT